ncbi:50S ribosomal protein L16 [bacterium]|jgi:large subunit ribosomal protein L16|nr:50S ribosomal protein L16 [bacterium]
MLMPKKVKYRKVQRGRMKGVSKGGRELLVGDFGLAAVEPAWVSAQQIEAARVTLSRGFRKVGSFLLRIFPSKPITKKPVEVRMGGGKAAPEFWASVVKRERIICEVKGIDEEYARAVLKAVGYKLPLKTRFIKKDDEKTERKRRTKGS